MKSLLILWQLKFLKGRIHLSLYIKPILLKWSCSFLYKKSDFQTLSNRAQFGPLMGNHY